MDAPDNARRGESRGGDRAKGCYIYGVVPADVEVRPGTSGVGDPPGPVTVIRSDDIAALVSEVSLKSPLGSPDDLVAHQRVLDWAAAEAPVLPMRFGAVMSTDEDVKRELLAKNHDDLASALGELDGRAEYVVKGRYVEKEILEEILDENPRAMRLAQEIRGQDEDATRNSRIQLGEMINSVISTKREADTETLVKALSEHCEASSVLEPTHEEDAAHVALLADRTNQQAIERALGKLAKDWEGRVELRLLGPLAPYDFVTTAEPAG